VSTPWQILVYEHQDIVYEVECSGPVELGRQDEGEGAPFWGKAEGGRFRIVLARLDERSVARKHLSVEPLPDGRVRLTNQSRKVAVQVEDGAPLPPSSERASSSRDVVLPVMLRLGQRSVFIGPPGQPPARLHSLAEAPLPPGASSASRSIAAMVGPSMPRELLLRWLQVIVDVLQSAASSPDFCNHAAIALVDIATLDVGMVLLLEQGQWRTQAVHAAAHLPGREWQPSRQILARVVQEKRTFWQVPRAELGSLRGIDGLVAAPILDRQGNVIGSLYGSRGQEAAGATTTRGPVTQLEATLVELLAGGVATGLARLEQEQAMLRTQGLLLRVERDLEIGREIQAGFLPEALPQVPGWEVASHFRPAREVSGDFYDAFALSNGHLALVIADVCDKGVGAALFMTLFRSLLRAFAQQALGRSLIGWLSDPTPGDAARRRAALLADMTALAAVELTNGYVASTHASSAMFATLFFAMLHIPTGSLSYVNAGHDSPVLITAAGARSRLAPTGPAVGIRPDVAYDVGRVVLEPGDVLLTYTDGVTEARSPSRQLFSEGRLLSLLEGGGVTSVAGLLARIVSALHEHTAGTEASDDVTMLAVRRQ
jgi:sigma-B regulation protein RsbU (phosphoserine phosphatase)